MPPATSVIAKQRSSRLIAKVEAREIYTARLNNPPRSAKLSIRIESDDDVAVLLLDTDAIGATPNPGHSLFEGKTLDRLDFSLRVPESGDYYLVVDNRNDTAAPNFTLSVLASAESDSTLPEEASAKQ